VPISDELINQSVGKAPHELFVLLEALGREQAIQQGTVRGVPRRVE
jgi:hypothetical protein